MIPPVKVGNVTIPISKRGDGRFWVLFRENGKPVRRPYRKLEKAKVQARIIATKLANNEPVLSSFNAVDREIYQHAEHIVRPFGISVVGALAHWADGKKKETEGPQRQLMPEVVEKLLVSKEDHKLSARYMRGLRFDLRAFARKFAGPIGEVPALEIEDYLRELKVGDRRRNNIRDEIVTLFLFAKQHGALPEDKVTQAEKVKRIELEDRDPRIYTPGQLKVVLEHIGDDWLDWVCCQAFLGIRPEEAGSPHVSKKDGSIRKLMWSDFMWDERQVKISALIAKRTGKIARDRFVSLNDTFLAWCGHHREDTGPVCIHDRPDRETGRLAQIIGKERVWDGERLVPGFQWIPDGLRHSYASYWQSLHKDMARLKEEMGNSERVNRKFYYNPQPAAVATRWWQLLPADGANKIKQLPLGLAFA